MIDNVFLATLVSAFITVVALGHVLLIIAIWPDPSARRRDSQFDPAGKGRTLHLPG
jgi:hypothetical protein